MRIQEKLQIRSYASLEANLLKAATELPHRYDTKLLQTDSYAQCLGSVKI